MSAEASNVATETKSSGTKKKAAVEEPKAAAAPAEAPGPQVESQHDRFETLIQYEPNAKLPAAVVLVWACALIGLGAYAVTLYFPELSLWYH
jgi:hypothetical protein